jgi:hypothetical protein
MIVRTVFYAYYWDQESSSLSSTALLLGLGLSFSFLILYTVGKTPLTGDQPLARPLPTQNKHTQTSMPSVGFESTISVLEQRRQFMR